MRPTLLYYWLLLPELECCCTIVSCWDYLWYSSDIIIHVANWIMVVLLVFTATEYVQCEWMLIDSAWISAIWVFMLCLLPFLFRELSLENSSDLYLEHMWGFIVLLLACQCCICFWLEYLVLIDNVLCFTLFALYLFLFRLNRIWVSITIYSFFNSPSKQFNMWD